MKPQYEGLVGDIGGTHARLALVDSTGHVRSPRSFEARDYGSLNDVIDEYLRTSAGKHRPTRAVLAVAGPVLDGEIAFTNLDWQVSEGELLAHFEFEAVQLLNDFAAQALACPMLEPENLRVLGPVKRGAPDCPMVVLGAGTGFGVAGLARGARGDIPIPSEGGHAAFAPVDEVETEVWKRLHERHGRVSIERLLSGPGLYDLYRALADIDGVPSVLTDEKAVTEAAATDPLAGRTVDRFCDIMGAVAGDLALSFGARGGVFISGGIAPRMADRLARGGFRARFEDKGRLSHYLHEIPTSLVLHPYPAILGAARQMLQMERL
jgi:glucokinase